MNCISEEEFDSLDSGETIDVIKGKDDLVGEEKIEKLKMVAIQCVQSFVRQNFICTNCDYPFLTNELLGELSRLFPDPLVVLSPVDGYIPAFKRLKNASLLCYAIQQIDHFKPKCSFSDCIWTIRILMIKQSIINEVSPDILEKLRELVGFLEDHLENMDDKKTKIQCYLLSSQIFIWYHEVESASKFLNQAIELSDIEIGLTGELGRKTKYQTESKSQLKVIISRKNQSTQSDLNSNDTTDGNDDDDAALIMKSCELPQNVNLMDDTLLIKVKYDNNSESNEIDLSPEEEAIICGKISYLICSCGSQDNMVQEQVSVYLDYLIDHCKVWPVAYKCLYLRSLLEIEKPRKVERSLSQLEVLIKSVNGASCSGHCSWKFNLFYSVLVEPIWKIEKTLADLLFAMGAIKSALEMYLDFDLWENIINCYLRLDLRDKAEAVVRRQLEQGETPYLLCILGDVTLDKNHYLKAWELSENRSFRAQKSLGDWHFSRKEYAESVGYYTQALEINPTIYGAWSRLAFAALTTQDYPLSAKAYRRVVNFESDNFEAWNNLSKAYIKMHDKPRAFRTLQESIKCNYDEWRVWENLLLVSMDIGAFDEVIRAWHRLLDLKNRYDDGQLIEILVNSVIADVEGANGEKTSKLIPKVQQLLGRIVVKSPASAQTWKSYGKLNLSIGENVDKIVNCLTKSHQACVRKDNWEKDSSKIIEVLTNCDELSDFYLTIYEKCDNPDERDRFLSSFRLSLRSLIVTTERNCQYWETSENKIAIEKLLNHLNEQSKIICSKLGIDP